MLKLCKLIETKYAQNVNIKICSVFSAYFKFWNTFNVLPVYSWLMQFRWHETEEMRKKNDNDVDDDDNNIKQTFADRMPVNKMKIL